MASPSKLNLNTTALRRKETDINSQKVLILIEIKIMHRILGFHRIRQTGATPESPIQACINLQPRSRDPPPCMASSVFPTQSSVRAMIQSAFLVLGCTKTFDNRFRIPGKSPHFQKLDHVLGLIQYMGSARLEAPNRQRCFNAHSAQRHAA